MVKKVPLLFSHASNALKDITVLMVRKQYVQRDLTAQLAQRLQLFAKSENIIVALENIFLAHA